MMDCLHNPRNGAPRSRLALEPQVSATLFVLGRRRCRELAKRLEPTGSAAAGSDRDGDGGLKFI